MIILYGIRRSKPARVGYRSDYCLTCDAERISQQIRSTDSVHVFFVPVFPLGVRRRWECTACGSNPHDRVKTARWVKILAAVLLIPMMVVPWLPLDPRMNHDPGLLWFMRVVFPLCFVGLIRSIRSDQGGDPSLEQRLANLPPLLGETCLYCNGLLAPGTVRTCRDCGITRYDAVRLKT